MFEAIESIIEWNEVAWNKGTFNRHLETSMLAEELAEVIIGLKEGNRVEVVDGILDVFWVWIGTLYKMGLSAEQINACFEEIKKSNFSKFIPNANGGWEVIRDASWKIQKPQGYFKPELGKILE